MAEKVENDNRDIGALLDCCLNAFSAFSSECELDGHLAVLPPPSQVVIAEFCDDSDHATRQEECNAPVMRFKRARPSDAALGPFWDSTDTVSQAGFSSEPLKEEQESNRVAGRTNTVPKFEDIDPMEAFMSEISPVSMSELFGTSPKRGYQISTSGVRQARPRPLKRSRKSIARPRTRQANQASPAIVAP